MISPSPTQQQPGRDVKPEPRKVKSTPTRKRTGQTPLALFIKAIFRPLFKGIYYLLRGIQTHKLVTLCVIVLLLGSIVATSYFSTGQLPLGVGNDPFNFHVHGKNGGGDTVKNWLYALRDGDSATMSLIDKDMSQPPNPDQLISQFSQTKAHLTWKSINVTGVYPEADTTIDSFVEVDLSATGPGGNVSGIMIWHFVTITQTSELLLNVNLVDFRAPLR
jgi:hypothetical protein